jgi:hypothetical protein
MRPYKSVVLAMMIAAGCVGSVGCRGDRDDGPENGGLLDRPDERRPRVAEYGHDKDKDWRKNPVLYD